MLRFTAEARRFPKIIFYRWQTKSPSVPAVNPSFLQPYLVDLLAGWVDGAGIEPAYSRRIFRNAYRPIFVAVGGIEPPFFACNRTIGLFIHKTTIQPSCALLPFSCRRITRVVYSPSFPLVIWRGCVLNAMRTGHGLVLKFCGGDWIRTSDFGIMRPATYQLVHPAMLSVLKTLVGNSPTCFIVKGHPRINTLATLLVWLDLNQHYL